jgi:hypothetical protein
MADNPLGFLGLEGVLKTQFENLASVIDKERLEKNFNMVVEGLEGLKNNALFGPSKINDAGPASASAPTLSRSASAKPLSRASSAPALSQTPSAPAPAPASPPPPQVPKRSASASVSPSSIPSPKSWNNPFSGMSGASSNYGQDFKNALSGVGGVMGEASSQTGQAVRSWVSNVSEYQVSTWFEL